MSPSKVSTIQWDSFANIVNGENRSSKNTTNGVDSTTGEKLWPVPIASQQDVDEAVAAGVKAFESWRDVPVAKRKEMLRKYKDLLMSYENELTDLLCKETGKPRYVAEFETKGIASWFDHHDKLEMPEEVIEDDDKIITTRFTPLGVVGAICPWNFPIVLSVGKIIPAVLTGNVIIVKPSPFTPYTALKCGELAQEIFPPGVVQILGGDDKLGPMFTAHPDIAKISFTGSIATGKKIMAASAQTLKRVTLELGGNDASIVLPDVDVKKIAPELCMGAFQNSGQVCVATKRIYVHEDIYDEVLKGMVEFTKSIKVGNSNDGVLLGPIQNKMQFEKVKDYFADTKAQGYKFAVGSPDAVYTDEKKGGFFIQPTIIDNPPDDSRIVQEEPFGPIVPLLKYRDIEEVIKRANDSKAGLGACVWGKDVAKAESIAKRLEAGSVFVNSFEKADPRAAFGGHKQSGIGAEWGSEGLKSFCNPHVIHLYKNIF